MLIDRSVFDPDRISPETRQMREELRRQLKRQPGPWEFDSVDEWRQMVDAWRAPPEQSGVAWAENRTIEGRTGRDIGLRVFVGDTVNGVYLHLHGGGFVLGPSPIEDRHAVFLRQLGRRLSVSTIALLRSIRGLLPSTMPRMPQVGW